MHAKSRLTTENLLRVEDNERYAPPAWLAIQLTHHDVWLDFFYRVQEPVADLKPGDDLIVSGDECLTRQRQPVLKFSKLFMERLNAITAKGYKLITATVNFIVYWRKENSPQEVKIVLPKIYFERQHNSLF